MLSFPSYKSYDPAHHDPPNKVYELVVDRLEEKYQPLEFPLVIAPKSLAEMIIYKTSFDALNWNPPKWSKPSNTLRIIHNLDYIHFSKYLDKPQLLHLHKLTLHYYITTEQAWVAFLEHLYDHDDRELLTRIEAAGNPVQNRPEYLTKMKK